MSPVELTSFNYGFGKTSNIKLERMGDLITHAVLQVRIPAICLNDGYVSCESVNEPVRFAWVKKLGLALIKYVKLYIGGTLIDSQYGEWMYIWLLLSQSNTRNKEKGYAILLGNVEELIEYNSQNKPEYLLQIPLLFWFNRIISNALPIIAIRYQDIILKVAFNEIEKLIITNTPSILNDKNLQMTSFSVLVNYVYLDLPERRHFATSTHEYLIDQVLTDQDYIYDEKNLVKLDFTKSCKDIIWASRNPNYYSFKKFLCYTHESDWYATILTLSYSILADSIVLSEKKLCLSEAWLIIPPESNGVTKNKKITIENESLSYIALNTQSLVFKGCSLMDKIKACIHVTCKNQIQILDVRTKINIQDVSIPVCYYKDTRITNHDVYVNQFDNFGVYIDGSGDPTETASLYCDSYEIIKRHTSKFFNTLIPYYYCGISIPRGINVYPFCLFLQTFEPSGTINFSGFKSAYLKLWSEHKKKEFYKPEYELFVFSRCYNRLLIDHGMIGLFV
jgi:hypothetical protein